MEEEPQYLFIVNTNKGIQSQTFYFNWRRIRSQIIKVLCVDSGFWKHLFLWALFSKVYYKLFTRCSYFAGDGRILKVVFATNGTQTSPVFSEDIAVSIAVALYVYLQPLPLYMYYD